MAHAFPPTQSYLESLYNIDNSWHYYIETLRQNHDDFVDMMKSEPNNNIQQIPDLEDLFDFKHPYNVTIYVPHIKKLLKIGNHQLPQGIDDFEFAYNFIFNQYNSFQNALTTYKEIVGNNDRVYEYLRNNCEIQYIKYRKYFDDIALKKHLTDWISHWSQYHFFTDETFGIFDDQRYFTINERWTEFFGDFIEEYVLEDNLDPEIYKYFYSIKC